MTIIMRSALLAWGRTPAPDLHSIVDDRVVTWAEVMDKRRKWQSELLQRKRQARSLRRACKLWVAYYDMPLMGGWQAFLETWGPPTWDQRVWIDRDARYMKSRIMTTLPLLLPLGSESDQWAAWKVAFARQYERRRQDRQPVGVLPVWWDRYSGDIVPIKRGLPC